MDFQAQRAEIEASKKIVHLMHGKEENFHMKKSKTGCRLTAEDRGVSQYVYFRNAQYVTCEGCLKALAKIETMQGKH